MTPPPSAWDGPSAEGIPGHAAAGTGAAPAAGRARVAARPRVGFQGEPGAFSEAAVVAYFGPDGAEPVPCPTFADVFAGLASGALDVAMVPVENSYAGDVGEVYDLLRRYRVRIRGELQLPVRHCLLVLPGTRWEDLRIVRSHPQALAQCREFLHRHRLVAEPAYDTAAAARQVAEAGRRDLAAIAARQAASHYGLEVLAEGIQDAPDNVTRFYHLEREEPGRPGEGPGGREGEGPGRRGGPGPGVPAGRPGEAGEGQEAPPPRLVPAGTKTSLLFVGEDRPGALYRCLGAFARREINLTKLTARPERGGSWQYMFFADLEGAAGEPRVAEALAELRRQATFVRVLGSFPVYRVEATPAGAHGAPQAPLP